MSAPRLAAALAVAAVAVPGTAAVAAAATAPVVSKQVSSPRKTAPLTIPGTGIKRGMRLPHGDRLVFRTVTLAKGQTVRFMLRAPAHMTLRGLAPSANPRLDFNVVRPVRYVGHREVTVRVNVSPSASSGKHTGRIWALVR
jgi:hypothetical protein